MVGAPILVAQPSVTTSSLTLRGPHQRKKSKKLLQAVEAATLVNQNNTNSVDSNFLFSSSTMTDDDMYDDDFEGDDDGNGMGADESGGKGRNKSRRELPNGAVETLKAWLLAPEHFTHPYPTPQDQAMLMQKTGIDKKQLKNWFTNARRRIWKPMLKKQIESGTIVPNTNGGNYTGSSGVTVGVTNNPTASMENPHSVQAVRVHYQQAMQDQNVQQQQQQQQQLQQQQQQLMVNTSYGNPVYNTIAGDGTTTTNQPYYGSEQLQQNVTSTLGHLTSNGQLSKADSHAVLMELFARDQDLVRQATESARLKAESKQKQQQQQQHDSNPIQQGLQQAEMVTSAPTNQHPMMKAPSGVLAAVPSLNSWPHFSSITSLNNLGTIPGVKSITSLSGIDLANKGNVNKMGNIAHIKSMESMGKNDSYAFLELFFGDRSSTNLSGMGGGASMTGMSNKGSMGNIKQEEDNEIGLSLEDESPSHVTRKEFIQSSLNQGASFTSLGNSGQQAQQDTGFLKRAYDDALAARGLISVSRSCEKLTDLELPAKIQRTLSQEFLNIEQEQQMRQQAQQQQQQQKEQGYLQSQQSTSASSHQYPGEAQGSEAGEGSVSGTVNVAKGGEHIQVASSATCSLCGQTNIDTQLRPCGHMFHERCLKPALTSSSNSNEQQPKCPMDDIPINSAVLAIPETSFGLQQQQQQQQFSIQ